MYNTNYRFRKKEKLCNRSVINRLFESGNSFSYKQYRLLWMESPYSLPFPAQTAVSVGKKKFRLAVERNRIKRLLRETWRLNKNILYRKLEQLDKQVVIMIIYGGKNIPGYHDMSNDMEMLVKKFTSHMDKCLN